MAYIKYPLLLKPVCKEIIWGGDKLKRDYNKQCELKKLAETWELTVRPDGMSIIANGEYTGMTLGDYLGDEDCPLLIKFIDAHDDLSIQVHPNDEYAQEHEGEYGKTEMWYIVEAEPNAKIVYGTKQAYTKNEFKAAVESGTLESLMNYTNVKAGDTFFIPSGLVHAIGSGCLIAEIQQNSNITYRVYDYNRRQADGSLRQLHVEKALDVIRFYSKSDIENLRYSTGKTSDNMLAACKYFKVEHFNFSGELSVNTDNSFVHILCLNGSGKVGDIEISKGNSVYLPVKMGNCTITGELDIIVSKI